MSRPQHERGRSQCTVICSYRLVYERNLLFTLCIYSRASLLLCCIPSEIAVLAGRHPVLHKKDSAQSDQLSQSLHHTPLPPLSQPRQVLRMDTEAYLRKHGWQGTGHSLHPSKTHAIKRPLLISKKIDVLGLGIKKNDATSDQWWMRAFDASLKDFGTGAGGQGILANVREHGVKRGGLYGRFVRGEGVPGTIGVAANGADGASQRAVNDGKKGEKIRVEGDEKAVRRAKKLGLDLETYAALPVRNGKAQKRMLEQLRSLDPEKRRQYQVRADQKGQPLVVYFMNRVRKNEKAAKKAKG